MELIPDKIVEPKYGVNRTTLFLLGGAVLVVALVAFAVVFYGGGSASAPVTKESATTSTGVGQNTVQSSTSSATSSAGQISKQAPATGTSIQTPLPTGTAPTSAEKQKLFDAMQKKAQ